MPYDPPVTPQERLTWAQLMRWGGYWTGFVGKWHLGLWYRSRKLQGFQRQYTMNEDEIDFSKTVVGGPCDLGFDYFFGTAGNLKVGTSKSVSLPKSGFVTLASWVPQSILLKKLAVEGTPDYAWIAEELQSS